jgi:Fe-S cluster assembly scaffold protein SufB
MKITNPENSKKIIVGNNEKLLLQLEDFDAGSREFALEVVLEGENAYCEIQGRVQTKKKDEKQWNVVMQFNDANQTGIIELRGTAEDDAKLELNGTAIIDKKSTQATAQVKEKIILFGNGKGKALPVLTVQTDNVKSASHSASVAPVSDEQILYLQSRGIDKKEAQEVLTSGFLK